MRGSRRPTGFMGPKRSVSRPRRASSSIGQAAFEVLQLLPFLALHCFRGNQGIVETVVFLFRHGAVDVVGGAFVVAGGEVNPLHVDRIRFDDGADGVVKGQLPLPVSRAISAQSGAEVSGPVATIVSCSGSRRRHLFPMNRDAVLLLDGARHQPRKLHPVDCQCVSRRHGARIRAG